MNGSQVDGALFQYDCLACLSEVDKIFNLIQNYLKVNSTQKKVINSST